MLSTFADHTPSTVAQIKTGVCKGGWFSELTTAGIISSIHTSVHCAHCGTLAWLEISICDYAHQFWSLLYSFSVSLTLTSKKCCELVIPLKFFIAMKRYCMVNTNLYLTLVYGSTLANCCYYRKLEYLKKNLLDK